MTNRPDYIRTLEIFLNYEKVNGKHLIRFDNFMNDFNSIFLGNPNAEEILFEMQSLDLIMQDKECDHIFGEDGMLLLDKGYDLLKSHRNMEMEIETDTVNSLENLKAKIANNSDRGHKNAYIFTLTEISKTYKVDCFTATISLCGKVVEIYLYELLESSPIKEQLFYIDKKNNKWLRNDLTLVKLKLLAQQLPINLNGMLPSDKVIDVIIQYRNSAIHFSKENYNPSKEIADGVIKFLIDILNKYYSS